MNFFDLPKDLINIVYQFDNTYKEKFDKVVKEIRDIMTPMSDKEGEDYYPLKLNKKRFPFLNDCYILMEIHLKCVLKAGQFTFFGEMGTFLMEPFQLLLWARKYTHNKNGFDMKYCHCERVAIKERENRYNEYFENEMEIEDGYNP